MDNDVRVVERALRRDTARQSAELSTTAQREVDSLTRGGDKALANAELQREELRANFLATPGGRLWLVREAASELRFRRVSLDANDERVPSPFDLDALQRLLLGANADDAPAQAQERQLDHDQVHNGEAFFRRSVSSAASAAPRRRPGCGE